MKKYDQMNETDKKHTIQKLYEIDNKSFKDIADLLSTYPNKIRRDAIKYKIKIKDKSEAQKNALSNGKHKHPTKGKQRTEQEKQKIGLSVLKSWDALSDSDLKKRKDKAKENWDNLSEDDKQNMNRKANEAVRLSSKTGSKLEKFILEMLLKDGYKTIFHQEQTLSNTKLQIDIFIPSIDTAIEIDGPSHFEPVWGNDALNRNKKYDTKKEGLILGRGWFIIRIKQTKDFSKSRSLIIYEQLKTVLDNIKINRTNITNRSFSIED